MTARLVGIVLAVLVAGVLFAQVDVERLGAAVAAVDGPVKPRLG